MRIEPFTIGDFVHVFNRGNRKLPIVYDENDKWRFLKILRYFNDEFSPPNLFRDLAQLQKAAFYKPFMWLPEWPPHKPLVKILCFCLLENHFHLLLKEIIKGGVTKFMEKLGTGFTNYINVKYNEVGRVFQGPYKGRTIKEIRHLQYLNVYIQVLNPLELFPGGLEMALKDFEKAFELVMNYKFSSLPDFLGKRDLFIIDKDIFKEIFPAIEIYKEFTREVIMTGGLREILEKLAID